MNFTQKISETSPDEIPSKFLQWGIRKIGGLFEELYTKSGGLEVKPSELPGLVKGDPLTPAEAAYNILHGFVESSWIDDNVIELAKRIFPEKIKILVENADKLVEKQFTIFGQDLDYSSGIRWHYDPENDHEFDPSELPKRLKQSDPLGGFDIKYPWELSRLQHFPRLSLAYRITGRKKYLDALKDQTEDWIRFNPVGFGPNWACTMDISIRAANMAYAYAILGDVQHDEPFAVELTRNLVAHGRFIANHLEWSEELTGNHYTADLAGLSVLGSILAPSVYEAEDWIDFARDELAMEIKKQIYPDGWDFEASTTYHRLVLECFLIAAIFLDRAGKRMEKDYQNCLCRMGKFVRDITMPDGSFPLIGDNDSGLFMSLQPADLSNLNYIMALAAAVTGDSSLKPLDHAELQVPEIIWLAGEAGWVSWGEMRPAERPSTALYPDGGLFILRSSGHFDMLTFRLGPVGQKGNGGHAHNDQLSVTMWFDSRQIVVDPGTACYTSDPVKRNFYRSTNNHATISIDGEEQSRFDDLDLFTLHQDVETRFRALDTYDDHSQVAGSIRGYGKWDADEIKFRRIIRHDETHRQFEILDKIEISENARNEIYGKLMWNFPLAAGLTADSRGSGYVKILDPDGNMVAEVLYNPGWTLEIAPTFFAPQYGVEEDNVTLRFRPPGNILVSHFIFRGTPKVRERSIPK